MMLPGLLGLLMIAAPLTDSVAAASPPRGPTAEQGRAAMLVFQRDWVLMNWALRYFDADGDIALSPTEAAAAGAAFRKLADVNRDGRISPAEYRVARYYILTRN
ncbi:hypothetical protein [Sphingomonas sp.]|uniref:hypothetical protein n=1 Tax=Sphingomonas sp. TaxID=28214 RepID=UPI0025D6EBDD|nr:hypothetical protein [Sphingomonas sp.]MBV9529180.1 hypothetical protein [Sphingomonas sp.]